MSEIKAALRSARKKIAFLRRFSEIAATLGDERFLCEKNDLYPCLHDATGATLDFNPGYLYHTAWAARHIAGSRPTEHIDISSCLRFVTLVSAFVPVRFYDYRPAGINLSNLQSGFADLLCLPFENESIASLSCMHVVEHIGLERYGDPFDPQGDLKAMRELERVLAVGGHFYFVVPVGNTPRIEYNAHRIYTFAQIVDVFAGLDLLDFAFIADSGEFFDRASPEICSTERRATGCWHFTKRKQ